MRRTLPLAVLIVVAACSSGDSDATATTIATTTAPTATPRAVAEASVPVGTLDCEDEPDPADYTTDAIPAANRPCAIPTALGINTPRTGVGRNAQDGDTIIVDYTGIRSEDATLFDTSYTREIPLQFRLGRGDVVQGWDDGLISAQAGSIVKLDIPGELAYGDNPPGGADSPIGPGDALTFVVEVHAVIAPVTGEDAPIDLEIEPSVGAVDTTVTELRSGDGAPIEAGDTAVVHLMLVRGDNQVVLISTWDESDPLQIVMAEGQTLPGVRDGLLGARVGSLVSISMPASEAFGEQGNTQIGLPAGTDLIAIVDVVGVF